MRTAALVRRHRVATFALALLAGLAAAVPMAMWAAGRRTADAVDQFVADAGGPDLSVDFCPAGVEPDSPEQMEVCNAYVPSAELATIRAMPRRSRGGQGVVDHDARRHRAPTDRSGW